MIVQQMYLLLHIQSPSSCEWCKCDCVCVLGAHKYQWMSCAPVTSFASFHMEQYSSVTIVYATVNTLSGAIVCRCTWNPVKATPNESNSFFPKILTNMHFIFHKFIVNTYISSNMFRCHETYQLFFRVCVNVKTALYCIYTMHWETGDLSKKKSW